MAEAKPMTREMLRESQFRFPSADPALMTRRSGVSAELALDHGRRAAVQAAAAA
jgi:hypothetical protein